MIDLLWNAQLLGAMQALACLTEEESIVLNDWANGRSIASTSIRHNMSERKINRIRKRLRAKYDGIRSGANLPERTH